MEYGIRGRLAIYYDTNSKLQIIEDPLIIVEEEKIVEIGTYDEKRSNLSGHDIIGDSNQLLIPGLVNCHTHIAMTLFRGIADDIPLKSWLEDHIWPLEAKLVDEDVYQGALLGSIESALSGVTAVNSMYWYPGFEAKAISDIGLRGYVAAPILSGITSFEDAYDIIEKHHHTLNEQIRVTFSLHSPYTVTIEDFQKAHQYILDYNENNDKPDLFIHTHLAESSTEMEDSKKFNEKNDQNYPDVETPVELLDSIGVLDDKMIAAHCIHVTGKDIKILKERGTRLSLNPLSNAKLGNHMPPFPDIIKEVDRVGLGTDGPSSNNTLDLFDTIRFLALYYKGFHHSPTIIKSQEIFKLATLGGAKVLNWDGIGTLEKGSLADIVTVNLKKPHLTPSKNPDYVLNHFAYSMKGSDVSNVLANGSLIVQDSTLINRDIESTIEEVEKITQRLVSK
ncbi:MAG: amidohydrolase [Candidatus Heimdallarchaeota archaeon]|nr:amidohydrolase [Candidatus Heimdallarchaeota archaeon]